MIIPSPAIKLLVDSKVPEGLKLWALGRLRGEIDVPLLYQGKEPEEPHEAITAAFRLDAKTLTQDKRQALLDAMKEIHRELLQVLIEGDHDGESTVAVRRWAEVVELVKPAELNRHARSLLHACLDAGPEIRPVLAQVAAAAMVFPDDQETITLLWKQLLRFPETAAVAFRRLLPTESFEESASNWSSIARNRFRDRWPANIRLLTSALLKGVPDIEGAVQHLARLADKTEIAPQLQHELKVSKDPSVLMLASELGAIDEHGPVAKSDLSFTDEFARKMLADPAFYQSFAHLWDYAADNQDFTPDIPIPYLTSAVVAQLWNPHSRPKIREPHAATPGVYFVKVYRPPSSETRGKLSYPDDVPLRTASQWAL